MKHYLFSITALMISYFSFGQNATITGVIKDDRSTQTIPFANVLYGNNEGTTSDLDGKYTISLPAGTHKIKFYLIGYDTLIRKVNVEAGETKKLNIALKEKSEVLKTAVVSAGKFEQNIGKVTVSMETLSPELVENKATTNANDIVTQVPSVHTQEGQVSIRGGAGFSYGAGSRVLLMVDGIPMLSADAGDVKWNYLPIENLESIEVIKGASSVLYGSSALNGVINIRTGYPKSEPITKVNLIGAMYDRPYAQNDYKYWDGYKGNQGLNFFHSRQVNKNFDLTIGGNFFNDDSFRIDEYETRGRINVNTRYRSPKVEGLSYGVNLNGQLARNGLFFAFKNRDSILHAAPNTSSITKNSRHNIDPFIDFFDKRGDKHSLKTRWFQTNNQSITAAAQSSLADLLFTEYQYQRNIDSTSKLTTGVMNTYSIIRSDLYGDRDSRNMAAYGQLDKALFKNKLNLSFGLRAEYFKIDDEQSESSFTIGQTKLPFQPVFRMGANYQLAEYTFLRASYGQGYRFPTIAEKYVATALSLIRVFPNPELEAETGSSAEIGIKQGVQLGKWKGFIDVSAFINQYDNMMEYTFANYDTTTFQPVPNGTAGSAIGFSSRNVQSARITGIDASIVGSGKVGEVKLTLLAGYTYMNPRAVNPDSVYLRSFSSLWQKDEFGNPLYDPNVSRASDSVSDNLKYRFNHLIKFDLQADYNRFSTGLSIRYNSFIHNIDRSFVEIGQLGLGFMDDLEGYRTAQRALGGVLVMDYRVSYELNTQAKLSFLVNNLLNREYTTRPGFAMPPRTFIVQLGLKF